MNDNVELFILRINKYIDKYYKCLLIKGLLLFFCVFFLSSSLFSFLEYYLSFPSLVRLILLSLFVLVNTSVLVYFIVIPLLRLFSLAPRMSLDKACRFIQRDNPNFKDTLINIIELLKFSNSDLATASVEQKIALTENCNFGHSLSYLPNKQIVRFVLISVFCFLTLFLISPVAYFSGSDRIIHFNKSYNSDLDIIFSVDNFHLVVEEGSDLLVITKVSGRNIPKEVFINFGSSRGVMQAIDDSSFSYIFKSVNNSFSFTLSAGDFSSSSFTVNVLKVPVVNNYLTNIYFPKYVNKRDTVVENQNILIVPQGTSIKQVFRCSNVDTVHFISLRDSSIVKISGSDSCVFIKRILCDENYSVVLSNQNLNRDFINFKIFCVPDAYPELSVSKLDEQSSNSNIVFTGSIKDDYGFDKLLLFANSKETADTFNIPILNNLTTQNIFYNFQNSVSSDIVDKSISFYFELYDNDRINGSKVTRSQIFDFTIKSISNQVLEKEERYGEMFRNLELSRQLSNEIKMDIAELRKNLLNNNLSEWERKQMLQQINNKTNQLQNLLNDAVNQNNSLNNSSDKVSELVEKQNLMSEMLNSLLDDELKQILQEISDLASEKAQQNNALSEDLKKDFGNFEKSIDKNLELLRKMKIEEDLKQFSSNLDILSDKQKNINLSENADSLANNVDNQSQFFEDLKKKYDQILDDNKSLERPFEMDNLSHDFQQIDSLFNAEKQQLNGNDLNNFEKTKNDNSDALKNLSNKIDKKMDSSMTDADAEDADDLRQILDNLFEISFSQEQIITDYETVSFSDPLYQERILKQSHLVDNFKIVRDSLYSLSRRNVYLGGHISKAAFSIEDEMEKSCLMLQERNTSKAARSQREVLKNANDMILILSESLKNIENNSSGAGGKPMKKRKQKPSDTKDQLSEMRNAQEQLKNQMRDLLNQMKNGDQGKNNAEIVKSLIQNELYQQMLNEMMYNSDIDSQTAKILQEVKNLMEKTHSDLSNKKLSIQTVMRQQNIVNKLLEAENAETEREQDERREAITGKNISRNKHENWEEDITFEKNIDVLKQTNLRLNSFYKSKFEEYLNSVNSMSNE